ncbi:hypothetical protein LCGC14_1204690 [marine sediment metagenome]|uniref:Uncharacterized protein n=1 Tax=marine sediment metagenome TaxID=412755 RepID=A0A0F9LFX5_9ZZZZ
MSRSLEIKWEYDRGSFETMSKPEFDRLARDKQFIDGPMSSCPSRWLREFGPYSPQRFAFGELMDGQFVCCDVAAQAAGGE